MSYSFKLVYTTTSGEECTIKYVMTAVQTDLDSTVRHWGAVHEHTAQCTPL